MDQVFQALHFDRSRAGNWNLKTIKTILWIPAIARFFYRPGDQIRSANGSRGRETYLDLDDPPSCHCGN